MMSADSDQHRSTTRESHSKNATTPSPPQEHSSLAQQQQQPLAEGAVDDGAALPTIATKTSHSHPEEDLTASLSSTSTSSMMTVRQRFDRFWNREAKTVTTPAVATAAAEVMVSSAASPAALSSSDAVAPPSSTEKDVAVGEDGERQRGGGAVVAEKSAAVVAPARPRGASERKPSAAATNTSEESFPHGAARRRRSFMDALGDFAKRHALYFDPATTRHQYVSYQQSHLDKAQRRRGLFQWLLPMDHSSNLSLLQEDSNSTSGGGSGGGGTTSLRFDDNTASLDRCLLQLALRACRQDNVATVVARPVRTSNDLKSLQPSSVTTEASTAEGGGRQEDSNVVPPSSLDSTSSYWHTALQVCTQLQLEKQRKGRGNVLLSYLLFPAIDQDDPPHGGASHDFILESGSPTVTVEMLHQRKQQARGRGGGGDDHPGFGGPSQDEKTAIDTDRSDEQPHDGAPAAVNGSSSTAAAAAEAGDSLSMSQSQPQFHSVHRPSPSLSLSRSDQLCTLIDSVLAAALGSSHRGGDDRSLSLLLGSGGGENHEQLTRLVDEVCTEGVPIEALYALFGAKELVRPLDTPHVDRSSHHHHHHHQHQAWTPTPIKGRAEGSSDVGTPTTASEVDVSVPTPNHLSFSYQPQEKSLTVLQEVQHRFDDVVATAQWPQRWITPTQQLIAYVMQLLPPCSSSDVLDHRNHGPLVDAEKEGSDNGCNGHRDEVNAQAAQADDAEVAAAAAVHGAGWSTKSNKAGLSNPYSEYPAPLTSQQLFVFYGELMVLDHDTERATKWRRPVVATHAHAEAPVPAPSQSSQRLAMEQLEATLSWSSSSCRVQHPQLVRETAPASVMMAATTTKNAADPAATSSPLRSSLLDFSDLLLEVWQPIEESHLHIVQGPLSFDIS